MEYNFAFEFGQQKPSKENDKMSGLPPTQAEFCCLDLLWQGCAHPLGEVGHIRW